MLTPDDGGSGRRTRRYLGESSRWRHYDPELFDHLSAALRKDARPSVELIETADVLPNATFFSEEVPDNAWSRAAWSERMLRLQRYGHRVPRSGQRPRGASKPVGSKDSSKYVTWDEVERLWRTGSSILIYQHYRREKRDTFAKRLAAGTAVATAWRRVEGFGTAHVLFLLAVQPKHVEPSEMRSSSICRAGRARYTPSGFWRRD